MIRHVRKDDRLNRVSAGSHGGRAAPIPALHAVALTTGAMKAPAAIAMNLAHDTRGHGDIIGSSPMLPDKLRALATTIVDNDRRMASWYEVDYVSTSKAAQPKIEVGILTRTGLRTELSATRHLH